MRFHIPSINLGGPEAPGFSRKPASPKLKLFCSLLLWISFIGPASAAPVNDHFANRTLIPAVPATVSGDTTGSTLEVGDPMEAYSIWWKFTPQESGSYFISAYPNYSPYLRLYLYTGNSLNTLVKQTGQLIGNAPSYTWLEKFELTAGVEYSILVGSTRDWEYGPVTLSLTRNSPPAISITNPTASKPYYVGEELELRVNASDPDGSVVRVDYYYDYNYEVVPPVATSTTAPFSAKIKLPAGGYYYQNVIAIATDNNGARTISEPVSFLITYPTPHDFFADRKSITGEKIFDSGDNGYATSEAGEPAGQKSIWWSWTAPTSKNFVISSRGWPSSFAPRIDIYTGTSLGALTTVATSSSNGSDASYTAQAALNPIAGQTYAIRVTTILGMGGRTSLSILPPSPPGTPPGIDSFRLSENGEMEFMILSNSAESSELLRSPDLKLWTPFYVPPYRPNGYYKEVFQRPADAAYFYKVIDKIPAP